MTAPTLQAQLAQKRNELAAEQRADRLDRALVARLRGEVASLERQLADAQPTDAMQVPPMHDLIRHGYLAAWLQVSGIHFCVVEDGIDLGRVTVKSGDWICTRMDGDEVSPRFRKRRVWPETDADHRARLAAEATS